MRSFGAAVTVLRGAVCALARVPRLTAHAYTNPVLAIVAVKGSVSSACSAVAVPNIFVPSLAIGWGRGFSRNSPSHGEGRCHSSHDGKFSRRSFEIEEC